MHDNNNKLEMEYIDNISRTSLKYLIPTRIYYSILICFRKWMRQYKR